MIVRHEKHQQGAFHGHEVRVFVELEGLAGVVPVPRDGGLRYCSVVELDRQRERDTVTPNPIGVVAYT